MVRRGLEAFSQSDFEGFYALTSTEIKLYPRPEEPGVLPVYEGWDGLLEWMVNWYSHWDDYVGEAIDILDAGDQVLVVMHERGRMARGELEVEQDFSHSFKVRDGQVVEWRMYDSHEQALEADRAVGRPAETSLGRRPPRPARPSPTAGCP